MTHLPLFEQDAGLLSAIEPVCQEMALDLTKECDPALRFLID